MDRTQALVEARKIYGNNAHVEYRPAGVTVRRDKKTKEVVSEKPYPQKFSVGFNDSMGGGFGMYFVEGQSEVSWEDALAQAVAAKAQQEAYAEERRKKKEAKLQAG